MDVLQARENEIFDLVHYTEIKIGDEFFNDTISEPPKRIVIEILDQRKERGQYIDESNRRMWARIKSKLAQ